MRAIWLGAAVLLALTGTAGAQNRISNITGAKLVEACTNHPA